MRNFIDFLTQHMMQAGSYEIVAAAVCAALPFLALALFAALRVTDRPSYRFKARCKAFEKRSGAITFSNAPLFGKFCRPFGKFFGVESLAHSLKSGAEIFQLEFQIV